MAARFSDEPWSPDALAAWLTRWGKPTNPARLAAWARKGVLPPLIRAGRGAGAGPGARFIWEDVNVALHAFTLCEAWAYMGGRIDAIRLGAWFAGFEYEISDVHEVWAAFEELRWFGPLEEAVGGDTVARDEIADVVEVIAGEMSRPRRGREVPADYAREMTKLLLDPAHQITTDGAAIIRSGMAAVVAESQRETVLALPIGVFGLALGFIKRHLVRAGLPDRIRASSDAVIAAAHGDVRFLMGLYRVALAQFLSRQVEDFDQTRSLAGFASMLAMRLGRVLLLLDFGLRRSGYAVQIDATVELFRRLARRPDALSALQRLATHLRESAATQDVAPDPSVLLEHDEFWDAVAQTVKQVWDIWRPFLDPLIDGFDAAFGPADETS